MAKAKKLPSGNWRALVYAGKDENGKRLYESFTAPTRKEAEYQAAEYALNKRAPGDNLNMTVGEAIDKYIETKSNILSPSTVAEYKRTRRLYLKKLMPVKLSALTPEHIQAAINEESARLAPKTVRNAHGLLSAALSGYHPDFRLKTVLPKKLKPEMYIPNDADIGKVLAAVKDTPMELPVLLAAFAGLRRSEICGLKKIDEANNTITINRAVVLNESGNWVVKAPKTFAGNRTITIPNFVMDKLVERKKAGVPFIEMTPRNITDRFVNIVEKIDAPHFRFHDLRHYYASVMLALNIPDKYAMERMGHSTSTMLKTVYQHTFDNKHAKISVSLNKYFENICGAGHTNTKNATRNATRKIKTPQPRGF